MNSRRQLPVAAGVVIAGVFGCSLACEHTLESAAYSAAFVSPPLWNDIVGLLGSSPQALQPRADMADISLLLLSTVLGSFAVCCWFGGAVAIKLRTGRTFAASLFDWGCRGWLWWWIPAASELMRNLFFVFGSETGQSILIQTFQFQVVLAAAGWMATFYSLLSSSHPRQADSLMGEASSPLPMTVWLGMALFAIIFTTMNWQLYRGLLIPHGDSAMYEEHLWNVTHGKGFRSYLDQGLFLGEHIQVIHLLLIPLHFLWPSHMLLELSETVALAVGAIPVFRMTFRHTHSRRTATVLAIAWLLYVPLHYLDISIDIKTFRPICLGVPLLLFAIDCLEDQRFRTGAFLLVLTLLAKEEYALITAMLGMYFMLAPGRTRRYGAAIAACSVAWLVVAVWVLIPAFRAGGDVHYARYFGNLGSTPGELVRNIFARPVDVLGRLLSLRSMLYGLMLLMPAGFVSLCSPARLAVAAPLFGILCLMELSPDPGQAEQFLIPFHHFHAPLVPIVFWAAAAGVSTAADWLTRLADRWSRRSGSAGSRLDAVRWLEGFVISASLALALCQSMSPLGIAFWDHGSHAYWRRLYVPGRRAELFPQVLQHVPRTARVASTDYVHTRLTHCERSYDYSGYLRHVSGNERRVPADTDYIVLDTQHYYSEIRRLEDVPELQGASPQWESVLDPESELSRFYIVLKRVMP